MIDKLRKMLAERGLTREKAAKVVEELSCLVTPEAVEQIKRGRISISQERIERSVREVLPDGVSLRKCDCCSNALELTFRRGGPAQVDYSINMTLCSLRINPDEQVALFLVTGERLEGANLVGRVAAALTCLFYHELFPSIVDQLSEEERIHIERDATQRNLYSTDLSQVQAFRVLRDKTVGGRPLLSLVAMEGCGHCEGSIWASIKPAPWLVMAWKAAKGVRSWLHGEREQTDS